MIVFLIVSAPILSIFGTAHVLFSLKGNGNIINTIDHGVTSTVNEITLKYNTFMNYTREFSSVYNHLVKNTRLQYAELKTKWKPEVMLSKLQKVTAVRSQTVSTFVKSFDAMESWIGDATVLLEETVDSVSSIGKPQIFDIVSRSVGIFSTLKPIISPVFLLLEQGSKALVPSFKVISKPLQRIFSHLQFRERLTPKGNYSNGYGALGDDDVFNGLVTGMLEEVSNGLEMLLENLPAQSDNIINTSGRTVKAVANNIENIIRFFVEVFEKRGTLLVDTVDSVLIVAPRVAPAIIKNMKTLRTSKITNSIVKTFENLPRVASELGNFIKELVNTPKFLDMSKSIGLAGVNMVRQGAPRVVESLRGDTSELTDGIVEILRPAIGLVKFEKSSIGGLLDQMVATINQNKDAITQSLTDVFSKPQFVVFVSSGAEAFGEMLPSILAGIENLSKITKIPDDDESVAFVGPRKRAGGPRQISKFEEIIVKSLNSLKTRLPAILSSTESVLYANREKLYDVITELFAKPRTSISFLMFMTTRFMHERPIDFQKIVFSVWKEAYRSMLPFSIALGDFFTFLTGMVKYPYTINTFDDIFDGKTIFEVIMDMLFVMIESITYIIFPIWQFIYHSIIQIISPSNAAHSPGVTIHALVPSNFSEAFMYLIGILLKIFFGVISLGLQILIYVMTYVVSGRSLDTITESFTFFINEIMKLLEEFIVALIRFLNNNSQLLAHFLTQLGEFVINIAVAIAGILGANGESLANNIVQLLVSIAKSAMVILRNIKWIDLIKELIPASACIVGGIFKAGLDAVKIADPFGFIGAITDAILNSVTGGICKK